MEFGYMSTLEMPPEKDYALHVDELREQALFCEQGLFDHVWLAEHHFGVHGRDNSPNPFMLATDIGARTKRIRLGIAVVVLPLWHPLRVAENITLLDQMFRGRVEIGFGRASQPHEVVTFNPAADPRNEAGSREVFAECLEIVKKACTEKFFSHHGKHYDLPPAGVTWASRKGVEEDPAWILDGQVHSLSLIPRPYQTPHPPFWMACSNEGSAEVCAKLGLKAMGWRQTARKLRTWIDRYAAVASGDAAVNPGAHWAVSRNIYVAPTMEEARRDYEPAILGGLAYRAADPWRALQAFLDPGEEVAPGTEVSFDFLQNRNMIAGTPDYVADRLLELEEITGIGTVIAGVGSYELPQKKLLRCLELMSERVIPQVQANSEGKKATR